MDMLFSFYEEMERKYPVNEWKINKCLIWPIVRIQLGFAFMMAILKSKQISNLSPSSRWKHYFQVVFHCLKGILTYLLFDYEHNQSICSSDVVMYSSVDRLNILMPSGQYFDHIHDPIRNELERLGYIVLKFEMIGNSLPRYPRWKKSMIVDYQILKNRIVNKLFSNKINGRDIELNLYDDFYVDLRSSIQKKIIEAGFSFNCEMISPSNIISLMAFMQNLSNDFEFELKKINPKIVIVDCWYGVTQMSLIWAAHRLQIPVVDIQHGVAAGSNKHIAYSNWFNLPGAGYEVMPDYFWVWTQSDCEVIHEWGQKRVIPFVGGQAMNIIWCNPQDELIEIFQKQYDKYFDFDRPSILLSLQWAMPYPQWLVDFINKDYTYTWLIRLHPIVDENERMFVSNIILKDNVCIKNVNSFPLEMLIKNVDIHITMHSSVVLDALVWGCPSIVMHPIGRQKYAKQISDGLVFYVENASELSNNLTQLLNRDNSFKNRGINSVDTYRQGEKGIQYIMSIMEQGALEVR